MKLLNYFKSQGLDSQEKAFEHFINSLRDSIFTWDYFVDFEKVHANIDEIEGELKLLNSLIGKSESTIEDDFINLLKNHPRVRNVLPILVAVRRDKLSSTPIIDNLDSLIATKKANLFNYKIPLTPEIIEGLKNFFDLSGLKNLFSNSKITSVVDYCIGVEVGMDTNARKNRTGTIMENLLEEYIANFCEKHQLSYIPQATKAKMFQKWNVNIELDKIDRRIDCAVINSEGHLFCFETNYYSGGGSKLKATAGEYKDLHKLLTNQGITFIWVTDGKGWETAKTALNETFLLNDYVFNLEMLSKDILDEILL